MSEKPIGLIGVGLLGTALAARLRRAEFPVLAYDLDRSRLEHVVSRMGAVAADTVAEVAAQCRRLVFSLPDSSVVSTVVGQLESMLRPGHLIIDTTTGDPESTVRLGRQLAEQGVGYVDATVAGSSQQTERGEAVLLVGGSPEVTGVCRDLLSALSSRIFFLGPLGSGARMKLVVNLVLGLNRAVLAEGLALARACGVELREALEVLRAGPASSVALETKGTKMITSDFVPQAKLAQHFKDVELILKLGQGCGVELPLTAVHRELLERCIQRGWGDADNSAIVKAYE